MPPISDDTVQTLQDLVNKLESRVKQLEDKLTHAQTGTKHAPAEGVRMILMGPPGAGVFSPSSLPFLQTSSGHRLIGI
jgi:adenylate kinase